MEDPSSSYPYDDSHLPEEEEEYYVYHQPLSNHHHHHYEREFVAEPPPQQQFAAAYHPHHHRILHQHQHHYNYYNEPDVVTRVLLLFKTKGFLAALAVAIGVILFTHYKGTVVASNGGIKNCGWNNNLGTRLSLSHAAAPFSFQR